MEQLLGRGAAQVVHQLVGPGDRGHQVEGEPLLPEQLADPFLRRQGPGPLPEQLLAEVQDLPVERVALVAQPQVFGVVGGE
ncbi:hypothetical protein [Kitasatospora sp. NPDC004289]